MQDEDIQATVNLYQRLYETKLEELNLIRLSADNQQKAQKYAIKRCALQLFTQYNNTDKSLIWSEIYRAHVARKSGVDIPPETIVKVISADQSWKKSSGHAFEEMVKDLCSDVLAPAGIRMLLQRDISLMYANNQLKNELPDTTILRANMSASVFDLFLEKDGYVFGCVQAKTSIRDRVTRDREPSLAAMDNYFWSIMFVLDGAFLRLPKFMNMVKGQSDEFVQNGWHGVYAFSLPESLNCERIYKLDPDLENFRLHAEKAYADWMTRRQWFNHNWTADIQ